MGTGVDTLVYGFGAGPTMFHNTNAGERWGDHLESFPLVAGWRAYENIKSLNERGLDPLKVLIDRAHEKGIEFFGSLRQSHLADPADQDDAVNWMFSWQFRIDHPEWCLKGRGKYAFDWTHPEVRAERFALIEETVNEYDVDGFEIDWTFWPHYFEDNEAEEKAHILTEYMSDVRKTVDAASAKRGRPIALGARVLPTREGNMAAGMDVTAWIERGCLDFVVPTVYQDRQLDADLPSSGSSTLPTRTGAKSTQPCTIRSGAIVTFTQTWTTIAQVPHHTGRRARMAYTCRGSSGLTAPKSAICWARSAIPSCCRRARSTMSSDRTLKSPPDSSTGRSFPPRSRSVMKRVRQSSAST